MQWFALDGEQAGRSAGRGTILPCAMASSLKTSAQWYSVRHHCLTLMYRESGTVLDITSGTVLDITSGTVLDITSGTVLDITSGTVLDVTSGTVLDITSLGRLVRQPKPCTYGRCGTSSQT